ncbi:MAG: amidase [Proteobacteria bacterium]|nr:amidase [Pseudomonadota bacterium]
MTDSRSDDLVRSSAVALARRIRQGELCPVELMEATLERIAAVNGSINAICTLADDAMEKAEAARAALHKGDRWGPLHGLPVGIKDLTPTAGLRTTYGCTLYADHVPDQSALVVSRLEAAGAIVIGKTNTPEFATGGHTDNAVFGPTHNPWDVERTVGGSTGGGAAALACGMIALAEGTDMGGSLRIPAAFCGVVGLRPSLGLIPTVPSPLLWDDLQVTGLMGRTVADVALALQAAAGGSATSPIGQRVEGRDFLHAVQSGLPDGVRIGWCEALDGPDGCGVEPELADTARRVTHGLAERGASVSDVAVDLSAGIEAFSALRGLWMLGQHLHLLDRIDQLGDNLANNMRAGLAVTTREVAAAQRVRGDMFRKVASILETVDVIMTPTVAIPAFRIADGVPTSIRGRRMKSYFDWFAPTYLLSLTALPSLSVPCGKDSNGLPVGVQIVGPRHGEELILAVGAAVQAAAAVGLPPLESLGAQSP